MLLLKCTFFQFSVPYHSTSVIRGGDGSEPLLTCRVPDTRKTIYYQRTENTERVLIFFHEILFFSDMHQTATFDDCYPIIIALVSIVTHI